MLALLLCCCCAANGFVACPKPPGKRPRDIETLRPIASATSSSPLSVWSVIASATPPAERAELRRLLGNALATTLEVRGASLRLLPLAACLTRVQDLVRELALLDEIARDVGRARPSAAAAPGARAGRRRQLRPDSGVARHHKRLLWAEQLAPRWRVEAVADDPELLGTTRAMLREEEAWLQQQVQRMQSLLLGDEPDEAARASDGDDSDIEVGAVDGESGGIAAADAAAAAAGPLESQSAPERSQPPARSHVARLRAAIDDTRYLS